MWWWMLLALAAAAVLVRFGILLHRANGHLQCLLSEVHVLGGEDRWDTPCSHCGQRIRDAASIRLSTRCEVGSGWNETTHGVFHADRPECAAASDALSGALEGDR